MKPYKGLECPLDGYEIVLFSLSGPDGKTYALCPFCYNNPPFEGATRSHFTLSTEYHFRILKLPVCAAVKFC